MKRQAEMEAGAAQCEKGESEMKAITEKELEGKVTDEDMKVLDSQEIVAAQEILSKVVKLDEMVNETDQKVKPMDMVLNEDQYDKRKFNKYIPDDQLNRFKTTKKILNN